MIQNSKSREICKYVNIVCLRLIKIKKQKKQKTNQEKTTKRVDTPDQFKS